jgi:hypothetical protein
MTYQKSVESLINSQEDGRNERADTKPIIFQIFNTFVFDELITATGILRLVDNPPLRSYDPSLQQDFAHWIQQIKGSNFIIRNKLKNLLPNI